MADVPDQLVLKRHRDLIGRERNPWTRRVLLGLVGGLLVLGALNLFGQHPNLNTLEPAPIGEASRDGRIALDYGHVPAGQSLLVFMQFQVNPTNFGRHSHDVELHDGETLLARIDRTVTIFP